MWLSVTATTTLSPLPVDSPRSILPDFFSKDGRKIRVGDCALFNPPHDSPPFIGIIRKLTFGKEDSLSLTVNWLYRPSDVKLAKGASFEAAPNEIFYSFHKNETPAASLLHPCKVAFLRKGVELPSGICSFVCRRVYDIENTCLWWLNDKDYINERQEEIDQQLDKTRLEMNGVVQLGGRSPKSLNGPQLKPGPESVQNNTSLSSHVKGKKRERGDLGFDPHKRECLAKTEDGDPGQSNSQGMLKIKIGKITEKGGLVDFEGVERLVQLMQPSSADKKTDLASRMMLIDVIVATERFDCLGRFVQLKGLLVLDEWLQEIHKGKIGDVSSPKEGDKSVEGFLFALLRALDKLPVNLHALQTCNVGKSVNHLRSHKNSEIQKKARSLVDTWKKRVEAEMNMTDAKTGRGVSWSTKPAPSEVSHVGNRKPGVSFEAKSSIGQLSSPRNSQSKLGAGDSLARSLQSHGSLKSLTTSGSNSNIRTSVSVAMSELALIPIKEERSSSSSQSQNNSQCCSSDHAKTMGSSYREDARSSTTGSVSVDRISSCSSRHKRSCNGLHGSAKEGGLGKIRSTRNSASEKTSPSLISNEKQLDALVPDHGNNHRFIVRLPNTGRSPSRGASGGLFEDPSVISTRAPPSAEKQDNLDRKVKSKGNSFHANTVPNKNTDVCNGKDEIAAEANVSTAGDNGEKCLEDSRGISAVFPRSGKLYDAPLSSMDVLIESCAKISETNASASPGDDVGMNLLASVAAGEIPKSENASPSGSTQGPAADELCSGDDEKLGHMVEASQAQCQHNNGENGDLTAEQDASSNSLQAKNESNCSLVPASHVPGDNNVTSADCEDTMREFGTPLNTSSMNLQRTDDSPLFKPEIKHCEPKKDPSTGVCSNVKMEGKIEVPSKNEHRKHGVRRGRSSSVTDSKTNGMSSIRDEVKKVEQVDGTAARAVVVIETAGLSNKVENEAFEKHYCSSFKTDGDPHNALVREKPSDGIEAIPAYKEAESEGAAQNSTVSVLHKGCDPDKACAKNSCLGIETEKQTMVPGSSASDHNNGTTTGELGKDLPDECSGASAHRVDTTTAPLRENKSSECKVDVDGEKKEERHSSGSCASESSASSSKALKLDFDLNEGFVADDACQLSPSPLPIPSAPGSVPTSITLVAPAKGPFVPPENPIRSNGDAGWKGSAATSAFRPAEPRKNVEVAVSTGRQVRAPLDFDLNVADEPVLEDVASQPLHPVSWSHERGMGGLDLDLNRLDDSVDVGPLSVGSSSKFEVPPRANGGGNASRGFDLNNGPALEESAFQLAPFVPPAKSNFPFNAPGVRMNSAEFGNLSSWFPRGVSYSGITVPSVLPGRGEHAFLAESQRILAPPGGSSSFGPEIYRGSVLSSSPAMAFSPATPFQYPEFPFETSFPLPSNSFSGNSTAYLQSSSGAALCFPTIPSQLVGAVGPFPQPYIMNLPSGTVPFSLENRNWGSHPLDLNAGPSGTETERRDERLSAALRQMPIPNSQALTEEQISMYQIPGGLLKRKEPDGGWDGAEPCGLSQEIKRSLGFAVHLGLSASKSTSNKQPK